MNESDVRREKRAARRRTLRVLTERRLARQPVMVTRLAQASICSTERIPTDS
jgi:hypothetical protein